MGEGKKEEREVQEKSTSSSSKDGMKEPEDSGMEVQEEEEAREVKPMRMPKGPTEDEYCTHILTHLPYRNWCPHCVRGKKKNPPHSKIRDGKREVPLVSMDYMFMTTNSDEATNPVLVVVDHFNGGVWSTMVLRKGSQSTYITHKLRKVLNILGYRRYVIKCDQEPALVDIQRE
eukprot:12431215-Karenia_brevis.AAC.1